MTEVSINVALWGSVIGIVSAILGAIGAGVGVYVSMRLEVGQLRAEFTAFRTIVQTRIDDLSGDLKAISQYARQNTRPSHLGS